MQGMRLEHLSVMHQAAHLFSGGCQPVAGADAQSHLAIAALLAGMLYGIEQRYLTQLETLRTVGRLGQESKLWHTPGNALSVVVQDSDLGISRGDTRIPVVVRQVEAGDLLSRVVLETPTGALEAVIGSEELKSLGLVPGDQATALVKINEVMLSAL